MNKLFFILPAFFIAVFISCNNGDKKTETPGDTSQAKADSLEKEVLEGHDVAMPKSMRIPDLQKETQRLIDSIGKLPAKAKEAAAPYKAKLEGLLNDLDNANTSMQKWMAEFNLDSAKSNIEQRIKYLAEEKLKVDKVKESVLNSLTKADSVLKAKF